MRTELPCEHLSFKPVAHFDYYAGELAGVAECPECAQAYYYEVLAWDSRFERRLFALTPVPKSLADELSRLSEGLPDTTGLLPEVSRWTESAPILGLGEDLFSERVKFRPRSATLSALLEKLSKNGSEPAFLGQDIITEIEKEA